MASKANLQIGGWKVEAKNPAGWLCWAAINEDWGLKKKKKTIGGL